MRPYCYCNGNQREMGCRSSGLKRMSILSFNWRENTLKTQPKPVLFFIYSAAAILLVTALAKFISSAGEAPILDRPDPILKFSYRHLFIIIGTIELVVVGICLFGRQAVYKAGLLALLATCFWLYRFGLFLGHHGKPCACLGGLTDAVGISPAKADITMKIVLAYLLVGSYATLGWLWSQRRSSQSTILPMETKAVR